jgi:predicted nucleic acid-binding protein
LNRSVVVDASLAAAWVLPEEQSERSLALADSWIEAYVHMCAPGPFAAELTNALHQRVRRGEMTLSAASAALQAIGRFEVELIEEPGVPDRALALAAALGRPSTYDCYYLALAERLDCEYWTGDARFYNAARSAEARVRFIGSTDGR